MRCRFCLECSLIYLRLRTFRFSTEEVGEVRLDRKTWLERVQ